MGEYLDCVYEEAKQKQIVWPKATGDFWQYNYQSVPDAYWTGYFTTHPDFKRLATSFCDFAHASLQLNSLGHSIDTDIQQLNLLNEQGLVFEVLSVMQHHDAMTGTHMKAVG